MPLRNHVVRHRRLYLGAAAGILVGAFLTTTLTLPTRVIVSWDAAILVYLLLVLEMMVNSSHQRMRQRATVEDEGRWAITFLTSGAALASLFAIGISIAGARDLPPEQRLEHFGLAGATILLSWLSVHTLYAVHYAYDYYRERHLGASDGAEGGLTFPATPEPDYWDFCYFSFTIGMAAQTSDVVVNSSQIRRLTLIHAIFSFCFNTILLAITINIAAGLL